MKKIVTFVKEVKEEVGQVTWPKREEISRFTFVVLVAIAIMACFLEVVDSALIQIIKLLIR